MVSSWLRNIFGFAKYDEDDDEDSYAKKILNNNKKPRYLKQVITNGMIDREYYDLHWIPATTCEVERLFSLCRHIYSEFRQAMTSETMEILLYLRENRSYWDIHSIGRCLKRNPTDVVEM